MNKQFSIQPLSTCYRGIEFRSRTEARWAVFFDHLKIKWVYEPEGYKLPSGDLYLPDFWLPDWHLFVEVKGIATADEEWKCKRLSEASGRSVLLVQGFVSAGPHVWFYPADEVGMECQYGCFASRYISESRLFHDSSWSDAAISARFWGGVPPVSLAIEAAAVHRFITGQPI